MIIKETGQSEDLQRLKLWIDSNLELANREDFQKWRRYYLFKYLRTKYKMSYARIGGLFSKDHSTVIYALRKYEELIKYEDFNEVVDDLKYIFPMPNEDTQPRRLNRMIERLASLEKDVYKKRFNFRNR